MSRFVWIIVLLIIRIIEKTDVNQQKKIVHVSRTLALKVLNEKTCNKKKDLLD